MKRGPKPDLPSAKAARGTLRPNRDGGRVEIIEPDSLPQRPDWLTAAGEEVWIDDIGRVAQGRMVNERDATMFGQYCNLQGAIITAWRAVAKGDGDVPPAAYLMEARRMAEIFGICGARSRVQTVVAGSSIDAGNPFARNGKRKR